MRVPIHISKWERRASRGLTGSKASRSLAWCFVRKSWVVNSGFAPVSGNSLQRSRNADEKVLQSGPSAAVRRLGSSLVLGTGRLAELHRFVNPWPLRHFDAPSQEIARESLQPPAGKSSTHGTQFPSESKSHALRCTLSALIAFGESTASFPEGDSSPISFAGCGKESVIAIIIQGQLLCIQT